MKKIALALAASLASAPAMAGVYINAGSNGSYTGNNFTSRTTDLHIGYEDSVGKLGYYIQGGPAFTSPDGADGNTNFSGKLGGSIAASEKFDVYGEVSFLTDEVADTAYGTKIGAKFKF
ncbi:hypothetical protein CMK19_10340 [Candidatus Poribacteria bacterium]|nr:hypothetical protein [Candidatus Poribacteria bacterium]